MSRYYGSLDTYFRVGFMKARCTREQLAAMDSAIRILEHASIEVEIREPDIDRKHEGLRLLTRMASHLGATLIVGDVNDEKQPATLA